MHRNNFNDYRSNDGGENNNGSSGGFSHRHNNGGSGGGFSYRNSRPSNNGIYKAGVNSGHRNNRKVYLNRKFNAQIIIKGSKKAL